MADNFQDGGDKAKLDAAWWCVDDSTFVSTQTMLGFG